MKINFTKKQYRNLMDLCFIADWIMNAYREKPEQDEPHEELLQYVMSFAQDFDFEGVSYDKKRDTYRWTENYLESNEVVGAFVAQYDHNRFRDMFSDGLAEAALQEKYSEEELEKMDSQELGKEFMDLKQAALKRAFQGQGPSSDETGEK